MWKCARKGAGLHAESRHFVVGWALVNFCTYYHMPLVVAAPAATSRSTSRSTKDTHALLLDSGYILFSHGAGRREPIPAGLQSLGVSISNS